MLTDNINIMADLDDAEYNKSYYKTEKQEYTKSLLKTILYLVPEIMLHLPDVNFQKPRNFTSMFEINASLSKRTSKLETSIVYSNNSTKKKKLILQSPKKFFSQSILVKRNEQADSFYRKVIAQLLKQTDLFEVVQSNFYIKLLGFFLFKPESASHALSPCGPSYFLSSSELQLSTKYLRYFYTMFLETGALLLQKWRFLPELQIQIVSSKVTSHIIAIECEVDKLIDEKCSLCPSNFLERLFSIQASEDYKFCVIGYKYVKICLGINSTIFEPLLILDTKLAAIESNISQLKLECKPDFKIENNILKKFSRIMKWLELVENLVLSVEKAENFERFQNSCLSFSQLVANLQMYVKHSAVCKKQLMILQHHLWFVEHLEKDLKHISDCLEYIKLFSKNLPKYFDLYHQCFQHLPNVLQCSAWVKELLVVMGIKVIFVNEEDIEKKLLRIKGLKEIFISKAAKVDEVMVKGKILLSEGFLIPFYYSFCLSQLEEEWKRVKLLVNAKTLDAKNFKKNWIQFNKKLNEITENIFKIKIMFLNLKYIHTFNQASSEDLMTCCLKCMSMIAEQADYLNSICALHESVLKNNFSHDLNYLLHQKLENLILIKSSLNHDLETYTNILIIGCSKENFQEPCDILIEWFHGIDGALKSKDIKEKHKGKRMLELLISVSLKIFSNFSAKCKESLKKSLVHQELFCKPTQLFKWLDGNNLFLFNETYVGNFQKASNYELKLPEKKVSSEKMNLNKLDLSTPGKNRSCCSPFAEHSEDKTYCYSYLNENLEEKSIFYSCTDWEQKPPFNQTVKTLSNFQKEKYFKDSIVEYEYIIEEFEVLQIQTIEVCDSKCFEDEKKFKLAAFKKRNGTIKSERKSNQEAVNKFYPFIHKSQQRERLAKVHSSKVDSGKHNSIYAFFKLNDSCLYKENAILKKIANDEIGTYNDLIQSVSSGSLRQSKKFLIKIISTKKYKTVDVYSTCMISEYGHALLLRKKLLNRTVFKHMKNKTSTNLGIPCNFSDDPVCSSLTSTNLGIPCNISDNPVCSSLTSTNLGIPCNISDDPVCSSLNKKLEVMKSFWISDVMNKLEDMPDYQLNYKSFKNSIAENIIYLNRTTLNEIGNTIKLIESSNDLIEISFKLDSRTLNKYLEYVTCVNEIKELYGIRVLRHKKIEFLLESFKQLQGTQLLLLSGSHLRECFQKQADDIAMQIKMFCFLKSSLQNTLSELFIFELFSDFTEDIQQMFKHLSLSIDKKLAELKIEKQTVQFNIRLFDYLTGFVGDYMEEVDMSEQYLNVEYEESRMSMNQESLTTLNIVLKTVSLAIIGHREKLDKILCLSKEFKGALPPYEGLMVSGLVQSCINKTCELEDIVIRKNKEIFILFEFEQRYKRVAEKVVKMVESLFTLYESGCDANLFVRHFLKYKYNIQCLVNLYSNNTFVCLPDQDRVNLDVVITSAKKTFFILTDLVKKKLYFHRFALDTHTNKIVRMSNSEKKFYNRDFSKSSHIVNFKLDTEDAINMKKGFETVPLKRQYDYEIVTEMKMRGNEIHDIRSHILKTQLSLFKTRNVIDVDLQWTKQLFNVESTNLIESIILTDQLKLKNRIHDEINSKLKTQKFLLLLQQNKYTKLERRLDCFRFNLRNNKIYGIENLTMAKKTFRKKMNLSNIFKTLKCDLVIDLITSKHLIFVEGNKNSSGSSMLYLFLTKSFDGNSNKKFFCNVKSFVQDKNIESCDRDKNKQLLYKCKKHVLRYKPNITAYQTILYEHYFKLEQPENCLKAAKDQTIEDFNSRLTEELCFTNPQDILKKKALNSFFAIKDCPYAKGLCDKDFISKNIRTFYKKGVQELKVTLNRYSTFKKYRIFLKKKVSGAINKIKNVLVKSNKYCSSIYLDKKIYCIVHLRHIYLRQTENAEITERFYSIIKNRLKRFNNHAKGMELLTAQDLVERYFNDLAGLKEIMYNKRYILSSINTQVEGVSLPKRNSSILIGLLAECDMSLCRTASAMECILQQFNFHRERLLFFNAAMDSLFFNFDLVANFLQNISYESSSSLLKEVKVKFNNQLDFINMLLCMPFIIPRTETNQVTIKKQKLRESVEMLQFIFNHTETIHENSKLFDCGSLNELFEKSKKLESKFFNNFIFINKLVNNLIRVSLSECVNETHATQPVVNINDKQVVYVVNFNKKQVVGVVNINDKQVVSVVNINDKQVVGVYTNDDADDNLIKKDDNKESKKCLSFVQYWKYENESKNICSDFFKKKYSRTNGSSVESSKHRVIISKSICYNKIIKKSLYLKNRAHIQKKCISCANISLTIECAREEKCINFFKECFQLLPETENRFFNYFALFDNTCSVSTHHIDFRHSRFRFKNEHKFNKSLSERKKVFSETFFRQLDRSIFFPNKTEFDPNTINSHPLFEIINCCKQKNKNLGFEEIKNKKEFRLSGNLSEQFLCELKSKKYNNIQINELLGTKMLIQKFADGFAADVVCIQAWLLQNESIFFKEFLSELNKLLQLFRSLKDCNIYLHYLFKNIFCIIKEILDVKKDHDQCYIIGFLQANEVLNIPKKDGRKNFYKKQKNFYFLNQVCNYALIDLFEMLELKGNQENAMSLKQSMGDIFSQAEKLNRVIDRFSLDDKMTLGTMQAVCSVKEAIINVSLVFNELLKCNDSLYMRRRKIEHLDSCFRENATQSNNVDLLHCFVNSNLQKSCESESKDFCCNNNFKQNDIVQNQCKREIMKSVQIEDLALHHLIHPTKERLNSIDNELDISFGTELEEDFFFYDFEDEVVMKDCHIERAIGGNSELLHSPNNKIVIGERESILTNSSSYSKYFNIRYQLDFDNCEKNMSKNEVRRKERKPYFADASHQSIADDFTLDTFFESDLKVDALFYESPKMIHSFQMNEDFEPMGIFEPDLRDNNSRYVIEEVPPYSPQPSSGKEINDMHCSERNTFLRSAQDQLYENLSACLTEGVTEFGGFEQISDENTTAKVEKYGKLKSSIENLNTELKVFFKNLEDENISYLPNFCQSWSIILSLYRQISNSKHEFSAKSKKSATKDIQKILHSVEQNLFDACELCESRLLPMVAGIFSNLIVISASFERIENQFQIYDARFAVKREEVNDIVKFNENVQKDINNALTLVNVWRQLDKSEESFDKIIDSVLFLCYRIDSLLEKLLSKQLFVEDEYMQNVQDLHTEVVYISSLSVWELSETLLESHFEQLFRLQSRIELHKNLDLAPEMLLTIQRALEAIKLNIHKNRDRPSAQHKFVNVKSQTQGFPDIIGYKGNSPRHTPLNEKKRINKNDSNNTKTTLTKNGIASFQFKPFNIPNNDYEMNCVLVENVFDEPEISHNSKDNETNDCSVSWASFFNIAENNESKFLEPKSFSDSLETLDAPLSLDVPLTEINSENIPYTVECTDISLDWDFVDDVDSFQINVSQSENQKNPNFGNQTQANHFKQNISGNLDLSDTKIEYYEQEVLQDSLYTLKTYNIIMEPDDNGSTKHEALSATYSAKSINKPLWDCIQISDKNSSHSLEVLEHFEEGNSRVTNHHHSSSDFYEVGTITFLHDLIASSVSNIANLEPDTRGPLKNSEPDGPLENVVPDEFYKMNDSLNLFQEESLISFNNLLPHTCPIDIFFKLTALEQNDNERINYEETESYQMDETTLKYCIQSVETVENNQLSTKAVIFVKDLSQKDLNKLTLVPKPNNQVCQPQSPKLTELLPDSFIFYPDNSVVQNCKFSVINDFSPSSESVTINNDISEPVQSAIFSNNINEPILSKSNDIIEPIPSEIVINEFSESTNCMFLNCLQTQNLCLNKSKESQSHDLLILGESEDSLNNEIDFIKSKIDSYIDGKPILYVNTVDNNWADRSNHECGDSLGRPLILPSLYQTISRIENFKHTKVNAITMDFTVSCSAENIATPYVSSYNITDQDMNLYVELTKAEEMQEIDKLFRNATLELQNSLNTSIKCISDSVEDQTTALQYKCELLTLPRASSPISTTNGLVKAVQTKEILNNFEDFEDEHSFLSTNDSSFYVNLLMKQDKSFPLDNNFADQTFKNLVDPMLNEFEQKAQICIESMIHISNMMSIQIQNDDDDNYFTTKLKLLSYFGFQQSSNDSLNVIGKQIQEAYGVELKDRIQEKLDVINIYWKDLQEKSIYVECMGLKGLGSQNEDISSELLSKRIQFNDRTLNEFKDCTEPRQQLDDYQIQYTKIFSLLTSYNNRLTIDNIEKTTTETKGQKKTTEIDGEKLKNDFYSIQYLMFDMCSQVSLLEKLEEIYDEVESPSDWLKCHHNHIFDFWKHILHQVASKTENLYRFLQTESQQKELSNNHDLCRRWLFELESCLNDTKDLLLLQSSDFKCETIRITFAYLAKTLETNIRMAKLITLNKSAGVDRCSDLYLDLIYIMRCDSNIVNIIETQSSLPHKFIPFITTSPEFLTLPRYHNRKFSSLYEFYFFEKEIELLLGYLSETTKAVEEAQVDIASDSTTIVANITRFQTFLQNIKVKELPLKHMYFELQKINPELDKKYAITIEKSEKTYEKCLGMLQTYVCVFLLIKSVNKQQKQLITWLLKFEKHLDSLTSKPERCIDDVMRKLVNISNIAQRFQVKSATKNKAVEDTNRLSDIRNDANKQDFVSKISNDWNRFEILLEKEKNRLDSLASNWKELKFLAQNLEQDVERFLLTVDTSIEHITVEHIALERELLMKVKKQLKKKEKDREQLKVLRENVITHILENSCSVIDQRLSTIDSMWFELQSKISDRLRVLSDVKNKIEWIEVSEAMVEVTKCITSSEELMETYVSPISLTPREIEDGLILLPDSLIKLEKVQPLLHRLDSYDRLLMKNNFREQLNRIHDKYKLLRENINAQLNLLNIHIENIRVLENIIIECEKQLDELNISMDKIKHLTYSDAYNDEYKEQLTITDDAIKKISNRIQEVESETEIRILTDFTRARINAFKDRLKSSSLKFLEIEAKAKSYSEFGTLNNELSSVEDFLNESKLFLSSLTGANIYDLPFLSKRFSEIQLEFPRKLGYLENLNEKLASSELTDTENNIFFVNETLTDEMRKFGVQLDKKQKDFEVAVSSIRQFEEDYNELEKWLNEKEMQYDSLLKHAHLSSDIDKVIDSCKKLQADLPVFSTFSSSMTSLVSNNNISSGFAEISLNQLNVRFDVLQEQTNLLCKKFCQIKQNYSSIIELFERTSTFIESCKAEILDFEEYYFSVQSNLPECVEIQKELQEILKLHDLDSYIEVQASTCLEKIETMISQLTKELLVIEQINKLSASFEVEFKKIFADIDLLNEIIQKNHSSDKVQNLKENVNRKCESIHEINNNIINLIKDALWASDIRCRQESCISSLMKKLNGILILDQPNNRPNSDTLVNADESAKTTSVWLEQTEAKLIDLGNRIKVSNVAILKACFEELKTLKAEKLQKQKIYNDLMRLFNNLHATTEFDKTNPAISLQGLWSKIEKLISQCFDGIKEVLLVWADYTETIKALMTWLRSSEELVKQPLHKLSAKELNNEYFILQKISNEYDVRHVSQATLKQLVTRLSKVTLHEDKLLLKQQLTCFNQLWAATKSSLIKKKTVIEKLIDWLKSFSHQKKIILVWLEEVENSILSNVSSERHIGGVLQIYKSDINRYDKIREQLKLIAVKVISHAPACKFSEDISCFIVDLDNRWQLLCKKFDLTYQGVEEALFLLKLLEEMLNMLEKWLHNITKRIEQIELYTCNIDSMHIYIKNLEVILNEFTNREKDFASVCELCKKIQKSPEACSYREDLKVLLECSEGFKTKWNESREKCRMYKTILENREDVYRQWESAADSIKVWLVQPAMHDSTISNVQACDTDNYRILDLFNQLKNCCNYLLRNNCDNSSLKVLKTTEELSESLYCVSSLFLTFQCSSHDINNNYTSNNDNKFKDNYVKYLETEQEVENWLCEKEIQMIQLRPYILEQEEKALFEIKRIKDEMERKSSIVEELNLQAETVNVYLKENIMEINHRYQKALKDITLWISNYDKRS